MPVLPFRTSTFTRNIYLYGNTLFTEIPVEYVEPVKEYAAITYSRLQIDCALNKGWITQQEYDETIAYIPLVS